MNKGVKFALLTAFVSGFAVFINSFAVKALPNAYFFTTAKNILVATILISFILVFKKWKNIKALTKLDWANLIYIGLIGGSIPFLLFFQGMKVSQEAAVSGAFIHKTLFIWVAIMAVLFLKERFSYLQYGALAVILVGIYMAGGPQSWSFGIGELMILAATLFWSFEAVFVKRIVKKYDAQILAFGRMFFGASFMVIYLYFTGSYQFVFSLAETQLWWIALTSIFLLAYVSFYYEALKNEKATIVTSVLVLAFPITMFLKNIYQGNYILSSALGTLLIFTGVLLVFTVPYMRSFLKGKPQKI